MNKPIPSTEAVEAASERYWYMMQRPSMGNDNGVNLKPWEDASGPQRRTVRDAVLPLLLVAYPQIVADVLDHYSEIADNRTDRPKHWTQDVSQWLLEQAALMLAEYSDTEED